MIIDVLNSGSSGNCYLLKTNNEILILDAGVKLKEILQYLNFSLEKVVGCVVTHEHNDHILSVKDLLKNGIKVAANERIFSNEKSSFKIKMKHGKLIKLGGFTIYSFDLKHDVPCLGYFIAHKEIGKLAYITDTMSCNYSFKDINYFLIECNYCDEVLEENIANFLVEKNMKERLMTTHMEISTTIKTIKNNDLSKLKSIILCHLSKKNSCEKIIKERIKKEIGIPTFIAKKGEKIILI